MHDLTFLNFLHRDTVKGPGKYKNITKKNNENTKLRTWIFIELGCKIFGNWTKCSCLTSKCSVFFLVISLITITVLKGDQLTNKKWAGWFQSNHPCSAISQ